MQPPFAAWMATRVTERSNGRTAFEAKIFKDLQHRCF
jgi:hypothetical protein